MENTFECEEHVRVKMRGISLGKETGANIVLFKWEMSIM